jgi:hypothetical protein
MLWQKLLGTNADARVVEYVGAIVSAFAGQPTNRTISLTSLTGGLASAPAAGDLVVVYFGTSSTVDRDLVVAGYTELGEVYANDTYDTNLAVAYKFMGATPDTSFTLTGGTGSGDDAGGVYVSVWRGVDATVTQRGFFNARTNSAIPNPQPTTPDAAGAYIVAAGVGAHNDGTDTFSSSDLTDFRSAGANDINDVTIGGGYYPWTSGQFDPAQFTFSGTNAPEFSNAACTMSFIPEQIGATPPTYIASAKTATGSTNTLVISKPSGTIEGDLMVAFMTAEDSRTWTGDTGWTEVAIRTTGPSTRVAYKIAGASEGSSYTFTISGTPSNVNGTILTFRNAVYTTASSITVAVTNTNISTSSVATSYNTLIGFVTTQDNLPTMEMATLDSSTAGSNMQWRVGTQVVPAGQYNRLFSQFNSDNTTVAVLVVLSPS